ncbi:FAD linked oxidase [Actibacterium atlanticum]|uniref:FAD linked oxidase n=1 Tax=Actibacterium atlanticum TaxID=1461693 RepID=A0A058ZJC3_9RHOB|nr:FAD-binding oxidoreductase [Actibacterium atlanticum]KCV80911.1 FAD linked oxidase [Actibacterium atlanticum]
MLNPADAPFISQLRGLLPEAAFRPLTDAYLQEPRGRYHGQGGGLVAPRSTAEVAQVIRACAAARVGVVPYGGGTGLVGGQVMEQGPAPLILSLERMRDITVHPSENVAVVQAGAILQDVQECAAKADRLFPLSLASGGSARIGGVLATNAGGVNVLRYGNARDLCLGVEAVLPDGQIFNGLTRLRKDNTGYDLRHLLIGAEGTLGVITSAALRLFARPRDVAVAMLAVPGPAQALDLLALAGKVAGESVSAFELISRMGFQFLAENLPDIRQPFPHPPGWCVLVELGMGAGAASAMEQLFELGMEAGLVTDGVIAQSNAQAQALWSVREHIPEANRRIGSISSHDISLPLSAIPDFIPRGIDALAKIDQYRVNCFGHLGDGNLHYNVFPMPGKARADHEDQREAIKTCVHDLVHQMGGSVSAEHGIGRLKVGDLQKYGDAGKLSAIHAIKSAIDPLGIMNPGVIVPG